MRQKVKKTAVFTMALALLGGAAVDEDLLLTRPENAEPYQKKIRDAAETLPLRMGDWVGENVPVPVAAVSVLKPNVMLSRRYINFITGQSAQMLLVQCSDARDLNGHWPATCYPLSGWKMLSTVDKQWNVDGLQVNGREYRFLPPTESESSEVVDNFMLLPDGRIERDIKAVRAAAVNVKRRFYGAAQMQVITSTTLSDAEREAIFVAMFTQHRSVLEAIRAGVK